MDRRELLKAFGGAAGIPVVKSVERLELKPEDAIVLKCDQRISHETAERLKAFVEEKFPGRKVLVLGGGLDIQVLRNA